MAHNVRRKGKTLRAVKGAGEPVRLHEAMDEFEEAAWVVERIAALRAAGRVAVLFRMNAQSRLFEEALLRLRMPYVVVGGVGLLRAQGGEGRPRLPAPRARTRATRWPCGAC